MAPPKVSVLLPVRNGGAFFGEALRSVLDQDFRDFEVVVVDDGSTDSTAEVAAAAAARDARVRVLAGPGRGLVEALNQGLGACRGELVARMDADDRCRKGRLRAQVAFLESHPEVGVLGGQIRRFGAPGLGGTRHPLSHGAIMASAVFDSPLVHPAVMFRSSLLPEGGAVYDPADSHAEDYGLWTRWLLAGVRFAALPSVVLDYRVHSGQVGARGRGEQTRVADRIRLVWLARLGLEPDPRERDLHRGAGQGDWGRGTGYLGDLERWLLKLRAAGRDSAVLDGASLDAALAQRWSSALWANRGLGAPLRRLVRASELSALPHPQAWKRWACWFGSYAARPRRAP